MSSEKIVIQPQEKQTMSQQDDTTHSIASSETEKNVYSSTGEKADPVTDHEHRMYTLDTLKILIDL